MENNSEFDPYRIPAVTGPASRAEKCRARLLVWIQGEQGIVVCGLSAAALFIFACIFTICYINAKWPSPPEHWYLIECPDKRWKCKYFDPEHRMTYNTSGQRVWLEPACRVTLKYESSAKIGLKR